VLTQILLVTALPLLEEVEVELVRLFEADDLTSVLNEVSELIRDRLDLLLVVREDRGTREGVPLLLEEEGEVK
jgi:hypothetical protein